jgi:hypothetical protein
MGLGTAFEGFGLEDLGRFRKFAKLKIVLKVENRSCGRFLFWGGVWWQGLVFIGVCVCFVG